MKKSYVKPYIAVESFQLDAAIAASCSAQGFVPLGRGENTCDPHPSGYFGVDNMCVHDATGGNGIYGDNINGYGDANDELCYHGPIGMTFMAS